MTAADVARAADFLITTYTPDEPLDPDPVGQAAHMAALTVRQVDAALAIFRAHFTTYYLKRSPQPISPNTAARLAGQLARHARRHAVHDLVAHATAAQQGRTTPPKGAHTP